MKKAGSVFEANCEESQWKLVDAVRQPERSLNFLGPEGFLKQA